MMDPNYLCKEILHILHEKDLTAVTLTQPLSERHPQTPAYVLAKQATLRKLVDGKNLVKNIAKFSFDSTALFDEQRARERERETVSPALAFSPTKVLGETDADGRTQTIASVTLDLASLSVSLPELSLIQGRLTFYSLQFNLTQLLSANADLAESVVHEVQAASTYSSTNNVFQALLGLTASSANSAAGGAGGVAPPRLRVVLTPSTGRARVDPDYATDLASLNLGEDSSELPMAYLQVHSKDALYPPETGVDTLHIVVVKPEEAEEYIKNYCPRGYVVAVLPEQEDDSSVGCARFWCCMIARLLRTHWAFILDDNLAVHEQVRASNAPSNPKHVPGGPKQYALQLMTGIKLLENVVATLRSANAAKVGLLSLRRAGSSTGNGKAVSLAVCKGIVCVNVDALFAKALYFRKEMHTYETLFLSQLCLAHKLATLQLSYVEYQCVRSTTGLVNGNGSVCGQNQSVCDDHMMMYERDERERSEQYVSEYVPETVSEPFSVSVSVSAMPASLSVRESGAAVQALLLDEEA